MNSFPNDVWGLPSSYNYGLFKINIQIVEVFMNSPYSVDIAHFLGKHSISNISKSTIQQDLKDWYHFLSILILYKYMIVYVSVELPCLILIRNNKYSRKIIKTKRKHKKLITANKKENHPAREPPKRTEVHHTVPSFHTITKNCLIKNFWHYFCF